MPGRGGDVPVSEGAARAPVPSGVPPGSHKTAAARRALAAVEQYLQPVDIAHTPGDRSVPPQGQPGLGWPSAVRPGPHARVTLAEGALGFRGASAVARGPASGSR